MASREPEVKYAIRTLLRIAGYPFEFVWSAAVEPGQQVDIYYGVADAFPDAAVQIRASASSLQHLDNLKPLRMRECDSLPFLDFDGRPGAEVRRSGDRLIFENDIVVASFWLLTGAAEPGIPRDRWDNLEAGDSFIVTTGLLTRPAVSLYGKLLRDHLESVGRAHAPAPWATGAGGAAFVFTHDVDYPQMIRWIESLRLIRQRGLRAARSVLGIWSGRNHFWKFSDWVDFEGTLGARPAFYFMARKGSLWQYARGTPDAFYDIRNSEFVRLFAYLRAEGCEIGLHASYHAHRSADQLQREKNVLEDTAKVTVLGGRHHYWHLDPNAPHETLRRHEQVGLRYDSSLGFEFFPGFRRGTCHPFRVFHAGERRELDLVELPPTWMDDHFDRRLSKNGITDPANEARKLMAAARSTGGVIVTDYHARGMNQDFYPRYGRWLMDFAAKNLDRSLTYVTAAELSSQYTEYESLLETLSFDGSRVGSP